MARIRRRNYGFTLVELLIVVIILGVIAAIAIPLMGNASARSRLSSQAQMLQDLNDAVQRFNGDTGYYPVQLTDLQATTAPAQALNSAGAQVSLNATSWRGPYMPTIQVDPVSGQQFSYSVTSPTVGLVTAPGTSSSATTGHGGITGTVGNGGS